MNEDQWGATEVLLLILSSSIAVAYPIVMRRKLATPKLLRERVLFSPRGEVALWTVGPACYAVISGLPFVSLALQYPFFWGVVAMSISLLACAAWYAVLYRRMISELERELMSRYLAQPDPD